MPFSADLFKNIFFEQMRKLYIERWAYSDEKFYLRKSTYMFLKENSLFIALADAAPLHLLILDLDEKIIFANKSMLKWWNLSREEALGKAIVEIIGEDAYEVLHSYSIDVLNGQYVEYTAPFYKNGDFHFFKNTYTPYKNESGEIMGFIATGLDISEKLKLESEVKRYSKFLSDLNHNTLE